jgi:two-component system, OmpR family, copper resistance phosphate regulon response regulator CusR
MRILVVEDEKRLSEIIKRGLSEEGYAVDTAMTAREAEELALSIPFDMILLDIVLPDGDGMAVCRRLRQKKMKTPVLMLTARDSVSDRVKGLDSGADDYLVKPFAFEELCARIRALLRREENLIPQIIRAGDLEMDTTTHHVRRGGRVIELTAKEYAILEYFMRNSNLVDVFIRKLRRKIDEENKDSLIQTVKGVGYRLVTP